jgi:hypothetical protein
MIVGGRMSAGVCIGRGLRRAGYLVWGTLLNGPEPRADSYRMSLLETPTATFRDRALALAAEHGLDLLSWYVRVLEESRASDEDPDLGALVRTYWELQRVTGRSDLRDEWHALVNLLWSDHAQDRNAGHAQGTHAGHAQDSNPQSGFLSRENP